MKIKAVRFSALMLCSLLTAQFIYVENKPVDYTIIGRTPEKAEYTKDSFVFLLNPSMYDTRVTIWEGEIQGIPLDKDTEVWTLEFIGYKDGIRDITYNFHYSGKGQILDTVLQEEDIQTAKEIFLKCKEASMLINHRSYSPINTNSYQPCSVRKDTRHHDNRADETKWDKCYFTLDKSEYIEMLNTVKELQASYSKNMIQQERTAPPEEEPYEEADPKHLEEYDLKLRGKENLIHFMPEEKDFDSASVWLFNSYDTRYDYEKAKELYQWYSERKQRYVHHQKTNESFEVINDQPYTIIETPQRCNEKGDPVLGLDYDFYHDITHYYTLSPEDYKTFIDRINALPVSKQQSRMPIDKIEGVME